MRGDWGPAFEALERARGYFARKGDRRLEALACMKLSSVHSQHGAPRQAAEATAAGLKLVPEDAAATRLRLEGMLAITQTWLSGPIDAVLHECQRIAVEAGKLGLEHHAAVAYHNAGVMQLRMGRFGDAALNLERAARYWSGPPTSPFADNSELVVALVSVGRIDQARVAANDALSRTSPWDRPNAEAHYGHAAVLMADGRFEEAIATLDLASADLSILGALCGPLHARLVEALFLADAPVERVRSAFGALRKYPPDPRHKAETAAAHAIGTHVTTACAGQCLILPSELVTSTNAGAVGTSIVERVEIGTLSLVHGRKTEIRRAWDAVAEAVDAGLVPRLKWWLRRYAAHAGTVIARPDGAHLVTRLASADPEGWRDALVESLRTRAARPTDGPPGSDHATREQANHRGDEVG